MLPIADMDKKINQLWYYDKKDLKKTPSLADNLSSQTEQRYRRDGARFIIKVGTRMGLRYDTMATGVVYFHRFYMFHSFRTFPRFVTACCCLFLAGKVEETPKKCKDIIKSARGFLTDTQFAQFGEDPKEEVMTQERILLQTIKFDLQVDHPYGYLLKYAKLLKGDKAKLQKLVQMAWTFVNDSLCTTLSLQWEPEIIAIALMYLASKLSKFEITDWQGKSSKHTRWWDMFVEDMSIELLEDICHQVLDLYSTPVPTSPQDSPPPSPELPKASVAKRNLGLPVSPNQPSSLGVSPQPKLNEPSPGPSSGSLIPIQVSSIANTNPVLVGMPIPRIETRDVNAVFPPPHGLQAPPMPPHMLIATSQEMAHPPPNSSIMAHSAQQYGGYKLSDEHYMSYAQTGLSAPPPPPPPQNSSYSQPAYATNYEQTRNSSNYPTYQTPSYYTSIAPPPPPPPHLGHGQNYSDGYGGAAPPPPPHSRMSGHYNRGRYRHAPQDPSVYRYHKPPTPSGEVKAAQNPTGIPSVRITGRNLPTFHNHPP